MSGVPATGMEGGIGPMVGRITCADCNAVFEGHLSPREIDLFSARHLRVTFEGVRAGNHYCTPRWRVPFEGELPGDHNLSGERDDDDDG